MSVATTVFSADVLKIDAAAVSASIENEIRDIVLQRLEPQGCRRRNIRGNRQQRRCRSVSQSAGKLHAFSASCCPRRIRRRTVFTSRICLRNHSAFERKSRTLLAF